LSVITDNQKEAQNVNSRLKELVGPMHASPPIHGARIVETILDDEDLI
jgi:aspartate aminotransferase, mitochondrial